MDEAMRAIEAELRQVRGVRDVLATAGGGFLGGVNQGNVFVRIAPHEERTFSISPLPGTACSPVDPGAAFRGNYTQQRRDAGGPRAARASSRTCAARCATSPSFNIGGGNFDIDFVLRGPDLEALARYAEQLRDKSKELGGIVDADTTLKLDKPELRVEIDRERAADLGVDMSRHRRPRCA